MGAEKKIQEKIADVRRQEKKEEDGSVGSSEKGIRVGFEKDAIQADFLYDNHLPQEWTAALIW